MLNDLCTDQITVYIACGYTDLRYGIDSLAGIIQSETNLNPFTENTLFLFCGRRLDRIKGLLWEGDGFLLLYKRLEDGKFRWPRDRSDVEKMTPQQFRWLMEGLCTIQKQTVKKVHPKRIE
jgi:transposase